MGIEETKKDIKDADENIKRRISAINDSLKKAGIRIPGNKTQGNSVYQKLKILALKRKSD